MNLTLRLAGLFILSAILTPSTSRAQQIIIAPNELQVSYRQVAGSTPPAGADIEREWETVTKEVLQATGFNRSQVTSITPVHNALLERAKSQNLTATLAMLSMIRDLTTPSSRITKGLVNELARSDAETKFNLLRKFVIRFNSPFDVSGIILKFSQRSRSTREIFLNGVQLVDYLPPKNEATSSPLLSQDVTCPSIKGGKVGVIGVGFNQVGKNTPNERFSLNYATNLNCAKENLSGDSSLLGAYSNGLVKRTCPTCYTIALEAGCAISSGKPFVSSTNIAEALVLATLRDAATVVLPFAALNPSLSFDRSIINPPQIGPFSMLREEISLLNSAKVVGVAAAGDFNSSTPHYPAANTEVIGVGATAGANSSVRLANSNFGKWVDAATLGTRQLTEFGDGQRGIVSGTSVSAALVAGRVAIFRELEPSRTVDELLQAAQGGFFNRGLEGLCPVNTPNDNQSGNASTPVPNPTVVATGTPLSSAVNNGGSNIGGDGNSTGNQPDSSSANPNPQPTQVPGQATGSPTQISAPINGDVEVRAEENSLRIFRGNGDLAFDASGQNIKGLWKAPAETQTFNSQAAPNGALLVPSSSNNREVWSLIHQKRNSGEICRKKSDRSTDIGSGRYIAVINISIPGRTNQSSSESILAVKLTAMAEAKDTKTQFVAVRDEQLFRYSDLIPRPDGNFNAIYRIDIPAEENGLCWPGFSLISKSETGFVINSVTFLKDKGYQAETTTLYAIDTRFKHQIGVRSGLDWVADAKQTNGFLQFGPYMSVERTDRFGYAVITQNSDLLNNSVDSAVRPPFNADQFISSVASTRLGFVDFSSRNNQLSSTFTYIPKTAQLTVRGEPNRQAVTFLNRSNGQFNFETDPTIFPLANTEIETRMFKSNSSFARITGTAFYVLAGERTNNWSYLRNNLANLAFGGAASVPDVDIAAPLAQGLRNQANDGVLARLVPIGEFNGYGERAKRVADGNTLSPIYSYQTIPEVAHEVGVRQENNWVVVDQPSSRNKAAIDLLFGFNEASKGYQGEIVAVIRLASLNLANFEFKLALVNEVTNERREVVVNRSSIEVAGDTAFASIRIPARILDNKRLLYRLLALHTAGSYTIKGINLFATKANRRSESQIVGAKDTPTSFKVTTTSQTLGGSTQVYIYSRIKFLVTAKDGTITPNPNLTLGTISYSKDGVKISDTRITFAEAIAKAGCLRGYFMRGYVRGTTQGNCSLNLADIALPFIQNDSAKASQITISGSFATGDVSVPEVSLLNFFPAAAYSQLSASELRNSIGPTLFREFVG